MLHGFKVELKRLETESFCRSDDFFKKIVVTSGFKP